MYRYETHLHTFPVSKCATAGVREVLEFYHGLGYDGVFITNHFLDGNINIDKSMSYREKIEFFFSDFEKAKEISEEIGIKAFSGIELSYKGTDFLVYGLDKEWYIKHPEIMDMKKTDELKYLHENGALVVQAHPYREAGYIDHIRLFPRAVQGVEIINACRTDFENKMAENYCRNYSLIEFAGTDNHRGSKQKRFAGMESESSISDEKDFVRKVLNDEMRVFSFELE